MWKEKGKQIVTGATIALVLLLQISFHIIEWLFHKVISVLSLLSNITLAFASVAWSIFASIAIIIIWSIAKLWNKVFSKDSSSKKK
ncbi:DUF3975 family protein [Bacillus sp. DX1.1]|uniref:DUF3975 family protein n=1 Tax=unclassified Bacillus (in: firmicutes) TaxID=185979 RepID=UPI0025710658|nr:MULTISPECIES: DUF3975 family protein [unclassified Bacillus (in: firmicutes)]MDM5156417.1 DUF3975 family protein [Bacillus sp. DX1.1]WJE80686.1 DUF3975 family protein [Bacillus sp. DX3.1]